MQSADITPTGEISSTIALSKSDFDVGVDFVFNLFGDSVNLPSGAYSKIGKELITKG